MRTLFFALTLAVGIAGLCCSAQAQNYPWCAYYGGSDVGGATNCGFVTFEQCLATVSGIGGYCARNTQYVPPRGAHPPANRHRHYRRP